ncbi:MAG: flagellar hook-associated protein FlgL [Heliobacteriaceae bacterium]|nr:flagellar hook-associated protein FlgL [Heliobacteriaceae bacterium]MDD4588618.1 flagellar hook-associated protein FlgL [Heliobacteriaceae bacterium]
MRITQQMMTNGFMRNINSIMRQMEGVQNQLASGKKFRLPEDDPMGSVLSLTYRSTLVGIGKYLDNTREAQIWLDNSDSALGEVVSILHRVRELFVQADSDTINAKSRVAIGEEINELTDHLSKVANTKVGGRTIFSGTKTDINPSQYNPDTGEWTWLGNTDEIFVEIDANAEIPINSVGAKIFGIPVVGGGKNLLNFMQETVSKLQQGKRVDKLGELDKFLDVILEEQASIGGRANRTEFTRSRLEDFQLNITDVLSKTEDADMSQVYTQLKTQENVFRAALSAGARIIQPSLLDFLR